MRNSRIVVGIIILVLFADQWLKFWVKTNMQLGEEFSILGLNWAYIHFVENPGMAFGLHFGGSWGKILLTVFRLVVVGVFIYMLRSILQSQKAKPLLLISIALIIAGALGNIIDSVFYGALFSASGYHGGLAEFLPDSGGYAPLLQGKVVDMFYFPLYRGILPAWIPFWGGEYFEFFRPVFNIADSAISVGIVLFLLHQQFSDDDAADEVTGGQGTTSADDAPLADA
ncbi:MAG TPA: lipoprotein signal peptidase [Saprospiraceae bacterium]|nr:lipoprotein signal peptidase [Saprospiraceae bacterium]